MILSTTYTTSRVSRIAARLRTAAASAGAGDIRWLGDVAIGVGVALLLAISPFTPNRWGISFLLGGMVGAGVTGWRILQRRRRTSAAEMDDEAAAKPAPRAAAPVAPTVWLALVATCLVLAPTAIWLYRTWTGNIWNNAHGVFIPVIMAYMIHRALRDDADPDPDASAWGFALLIPGLLLVAVDSALRSQQLAGLGVVLVLPGLSLLLLGIRRTRLLAVPWLLALFMIPIPNTVASHLYLRRLTSVLVEPLLSKVLQIPVLREETLLVLPNGSFMVADACSGFATLYASFAVAIVLAAYARSWPRRLLLLLSAFPLAVACNVVRVSMLVALANQMGLGLLDTPFHAASGVLTFWAVLAVMILIAGRKQLGSETG